MEAALVGLSGIRKAVLITRESKVGLKYLTAYYVSDLPFEPFDLAAALSKVLPDHMVPSAYVHLNELPLTINGKLDKKSLPEPLLTGETKYVAARNEIEEQLVWIYGEVLALDPDQISIYDDFFRLGGNSIMAIKLIAKINQSLNRQISVSAVFGNKSIAELTNVIEGLSNTEKVYIDQVYIEFEEEQLLSFSQEGLWFIDQFKGGNNAYNIPLAFRIDKGVDISILAESLMILIQRHEILRSLILTNSDGVGYQKLTDYYWEPAVHKVSSFKDLEAELSKEAKRTFCLSEEIPVSIHVFSMNDDCYLSVVFHHIAFDGWSVEIFLRELYTIYEALSSGCQYELQVLDFQYKDYALWQRNYLKNTILEKQTEYWKSYLKSFETLNLPLDFKRPSEISYKGSNILFIIPSQISSDIRSLAKKLGVSLYSVMLSGYYLMLSSFSGQNDIVVGSPFANRHYDGLENMIGLFVNTLVLRETIDFDIDISAFIQKVSTSVSGAQLNQDLPFEKLVNVLDIEHDHSRHPIFQVMFGFESFSKVTDDIYKGNSFLHPFEGYVSYDTAKFDITTMINDSDEVLSGSFNYASSLYTESTIEKMKSTYLYILKQMAALHHSGGSEVKLSKLQLLGAEDYNWFSLLNGTYSVYNRDATIHTVFERQVSRTPRQTALVYQNVKLTYQELNERSNRLAHYLITKYKIKPDELIPLCLYRSEQMIIAILAVLKAGGAYVPLEPSFPPERRKHILPDTGARMIITEESCVAKLGYDISDIICLDNEKIIKELAACRNDNPETEVKSNDLAYVIYTSGTTGKPKGVMIEHTSVINLTEGLRGVYSFCETGRLMAYTSYVFDVSVAEIFSALLYGNELHILDESTKKDIELVKEYILTHDITHAYLPPVILSLLPHCDFPSLQTLMYAGEPGDEETGKYWSLHKNVYNLYGPTECTIYSTFKQIRYDNSNPLNIGRPIDNTSVYVLDSYLRPVPIGAIGELYIGGAGISRGYLNLPELSSERFLSNPFQTEEERSSGYNGRIYKTGDLVRILPNGDLEYLGRNDSQIKIRGYRIEAGEVETALVGLQGIRQAVVECRENITGLKYLAAYYVSDKPLKSDAISLLLSEVLPDYMIPSAYVHLKALPVTINGKVDRKSLPEPLFTGETEYVIPQTPLQEQLADIYGEVLGLDPGSIGIHDDFFRLGGNSIMAIKLVNKIYQKTGRKASGGMVFSNKSIVSLSQALESLPDFGEEDIRPAIVRHPREQYLSFGQERLWFIENYEGGSDVYNIPMILRLDKETDLRLLQEALDMLLERHEILRTLILMDSDGSGYQIVSDQSLELPLVKVGSLEDFMQVVSRELNERFNLQEELPVRVKVLDYEDDYYLSLVIHHIAFDGWSIGIFLRDLNSIYQSLSSGILPVLPSLPFQYKDFALWQRKYVTEKILDKQLGYWLGELSGFETLNLPLDFQRPSRISHEGKTLSFSISSEISSRLRIVSKNLGVSLYSVMLSGYYLMLSSYSGQEDLIIGTPVANRHYPGLENLIGFFVNILVLRQKLDFNVSVHDFIISVSSGVLGGQIHQDLPFEKLVDALNLEQDSSRHPLFQVMFGLQSFGPVTAKGTDENCFFHLFDSGIENETAMFDLTTMIDDQREELCGTFNFATSLFKETTIEQMISTYQYILKQFSDLFQGGSSDVRLSEIHWVDEEISGLRGICSDYDKEVTLHGLFEQQTFRAPDLTALVYGERRLSYRELNEKANQLAHYLIQHYDICPDELIPVCFNRSEKMVIGILGVLKAGALMYLLIQAIL
ncbi:amino acid adenylation domain-containing protein [Chryseobacterium sp. 1B4]